MRCRGDAGALGKIAMAIIGKSFKLLLALIKVLDMSRVHTCSLGLRLSYIHGMR